MLQDFRFAVRLARKNLGTTIASFLALALGIGGATAIFSVIDAIMLKPLPVEQESSLVKIVATDSRSDDDDVSMADFVDWKRDLRSFSDLTAFVTSQSTLVGTTPERLITVETSWNLFPLLGVKLLRGRNFLPEENQQGRGNVVILSWSFWHSHFGGQDVLGKKLLLDERSYVVIGILPRSFNMLGHRDVYLPVPIDLNAIENRRGYHAYTVYGRLNPGVSIAQANSELASVSASLAEEYPKENKGVGARALALRDSITGEGIGSSARNIRPVLLVLLAAVLCVLLIACGNVANINLVKAWSRQREIAVRVAIGASRRQLFVQVFIESAFISLFAAAAGVLLAYGLVHTFVHFPITAIPRLEDTTISWRVLAFAFCMGVFVGIASGLIPAARSSLINLNDTLKQASGRTTESKRNHQLRQIFVAAETALAAILLIECGLLIKSFLRASEIDPAFETDHLLTVYLSLPAARYGAHHPESTQPLVHSVLSRVRALPGIISAAVASDLPLTGTAAGGGILFEGESNPPQYWKAPYALIANVSPQYFKTLKIRFIHGRDFQDRAVDDHSVIVNQALVRKIHSNKNPIGKRLSVAAGPLEWRQVIGVVDDVPQVSIERKAEPEVFFALNQLDAPWMALALRINGDPLRAVAPVRHEVALIDPAIAVFLPRTMGQILDKQFLWRRIQTWIVAAFAFLAITLASLGVYAVITYSVSQRTSEIGLRLAVGASAAQVRRLILWQGIKPALTGGLIGLMIGFLVARGTASLLFGTESTDISVYAGSVFILVLVSLLASILPAARAAATEPLKALRHE
jgi:putative ABC transport system permease protein